MNVCLFPSGAPCARRASGAQHPRCATDAGRCQRPSQLTEPFGASPTGR